jgi:hypothetical protein
MRMAAVARVKHTCGEHVQKTKLGQGRWFLDPTALVHAAFFLFPLTLFVVAFGPDCLGLAHSLGNFVSTGLGAGGWAGGAPHEQDGVDEALGGTSPRPRMTDPCGSILLIQALQQVRGQLAERVGRW